LLYLQAKRAGGWSIREVARWAMYQHNALAHRQNVPVTGSDGRGWPDRKGKRKPTAYD